MVTKPLCLACGSRYVGNGGDDISYGVISKRIVGINKSGAIPGAAATRINKVADGSGRYVATSDGQDSLLLHPDVRRGSKFPDRVSHRCVDPESSEDIKLVVEHREATGQSHSVAVTRPGRGNGLDDFCQWIVAENPISSNGLSACRAANAIDVRCSRVGEHGASHIADLVVGKCDQSNGPGVRPRIISKRVREIVADSIHAASAHGVELPVEDANHSDTRTWHVSTRLPTLVANDVWVLV